MRKFIYIFGMLVLTHFSCEKVINADIGEFTPVLAPSSVFSPDSSWMVYLSATLSILDDDHPGTVTNAQVEVWEGGSLLEILPSMGDGNYSSNNNRPEDGKNYTLKISAPGYESIEANSYVPYNIPVGSFSWKYSAIVTDYGSESELRFKFSDPAGSKDYYQVRLVSMDTIIDFGDTLVLWYDLGFYSIDPVFESGSYATNSTFSDLTFNGQEKDISLLIDDYYVSGGAPIYLAFFHVTEEYFLYTRTILAQDAAGQNPFSEPSPIYTNVRNGLGVFAGFNGAIYKVQ